MICFVIKIIFATNNYPVRYQPVEIIANPKSPRHRLTPPSGNTI
jgi:hypothetical protein